MLDMGGAEKLLGMGDMLYLTTEMMGKPKRVQGAYVSDSEIENLTNYLREQAPPNYNDEVISQEVSNAENMTIEFTNKNVDIVPCIDL